MWFARSRHGFCTAASKLQGLREDQGGRSGSSVEFCMAGCAEWMPGRATCVSSVRSLNGITLHGCGECSIAQGNEKSLLIEKSGRPRGWSKDHV